MKNLSLAIISILFFCYSAQAAMPPVSAVKACMLKFPEATHMKWDKENAHNSNICNFRSQLHPPFYL